MKPEGIFILAALLFGALFLALTPPLQAPDEWSHFFRAYQLSEGHILAEKDASGLPGRRLPTSLIVTALSLFHNIPFTPENGPRIRDLMQRGESPNQELNPFTPEKKLNKKHTILSLFRVPLEGSNRVRVYFPGSSIYPPLSHLPQAAGIALGRLFNAPPVLLIYMGRAFNLLCWAFLAYLAIKVTPVFKRVFVLLALTPTSLFLASSLSADALTNGLSLLLIAVFLRHAFEEGLQAPAILGLQAPAILGGRAMLLMFSLTMALSLTKSYFLLPCLFLLIPDEKAGDRRRYYAFFALLLIMSIASVAVWGLVVRDMFAPLRPDVSMTGQLGFISGQPLGFLSALGKTFYLSGLAIARHMAGQLGHFDISLPKALILLHWTVLILAALTSGRKDIGLSLKGKSVISIVLIFSAGIMSFFIYLTWTPVGGGVIEGIQGRYFIPLVPLFLLLFYNRRLSLATSRLNPVLAVYAAFILSSAAYTILRGYY